MINRKYTIKLCSIEKKYIYYRDNFKRLCIDNYKLQKENEELKNKINKVVSMIDENYSSEWYDDYETIAGLRDDIYDLLKIKYKGVKE
jgi:hypothetical protein